MISIILPIYNEQEGLAAFVQSLENELTKLKEDVEVIFINDGRPIIHWFSLKTTVAQTSLTSTLI